MPTDPQLAQPSIDQPYYREETVRIGRAVHLYVHPERCYLAFIDGHPTPDGQPHPDDDVLLHAPNLPGKVGGVVPRFVPDLPGEKPGVTSWHWIRACPWNR